MAYTKTQCSKGTGANPVITSVTAGALLVCQIHTFDDTTSITGITDDKGNTWTVHGQSPGAAATGERITQASAYNVAAGTTTLTITRNTGSVNMRFYLDEYAGFGASNPFQSIASAENASSANPSFNLSAVPAGALIVGGFSMRNTGAAAGANYTLESEHSSNWFQYSQYDLDAGAGGTVAFDMTIAATRWTGIAAVFNTAAAPTVAKSVFPFFLR